MRIILELTEAHEPVDVPRSCYSCRRSFCLGPVVAAAESDDGAIACGVVCADCLREGSEYITERLEQRAQWAREIADEEEDLAAEGVEAPTIEDLAALERVAAL